MNAQELADNAYKNATTQFEYDVALTMKQLIKENSQQSDRIAELEKVSSKPVAEVIEWEETYGHTFKKRTVSTVKWLENVEVGTKLYTHPVKQLSDDKYQLWRYRKEGQFDQFSYVEWNDEDSAGYEVTMFLPV